jgi:hypothetical protein
MPRSVLLALCLLVAGPFPAPAQGTADWRAVFEARKTTYENLEQQARNEVRFEAEAAASRFLIALRELQAAMDRKGELEKNIVLLDEIKSFEFSQTLSGPTVLAAVPELRPAAEAMEKDIQGARRRAVENLAKSTPTYLKTLQDMEAASTRAGQTALAEAVRAERVRVEEEARKQQEVLAAAAPGESAASPDPGGAAPTTPRTLPAFSRMLPALDAKILLYLSFDADWGAGDIPDHSGHGIACRQVKVGFVPRGKRGACASLSNSAYLEIPDHPSFQNQEYFSFSFWFRSREPRSSLLMAGFDPEEGGEPSFAITLRGEGRLAFFIGEQRADSSRDKLHNNTWHHVVAVRSPQELALYLDGEFAGKRTTKEPLPRTLPKLYFGHLVYSRYYDSSLGTYRYSTHRLAGELDEVVFFNAPLTAQDVKTIYQSQR